MKSFLQNNDIEIHSMYNEGKFVVAERFIRTFHSTIKMIPVDLKSNTCIDSSKKNNSKDPKFKIGDIQNIKILLQNVTLYIGLKNFF